MKILAPILLLILSSVAATVHAAPLAPSLTTPKSTLIGKVFHDKNGNGFQDNGEAGIAGVRLATVTGLLMETDGYGRFHLPEMGEPQSWSQNFILKLDKASLPEGARLTTENPRVIHGSIGLNNISFGVSY
ncbi:MAG: hypothetical protein L3J51_10255 [Cocleimonas sp.]|nr:hypothetical protein [Cocleimonas sp.]